MGRADAQNAGSVIGRQGATIGAFREESGAKINISDTIVGAPDRIITATGPPAAVAKAYLLITAKLEEVRVVRCCSRGETLVGRFRLAPHTPPPHPMP